MAKLIFGIKTPKPRSVSYIQNYSEKHGLNHFPHYSISYEGFLNFFSNGEQLKVQPSINQVVVFNEKSQLISLRDSVTCSNDYMDLITEYKNREVTQINPNIYFSDVFCDSVSALSGELRSFEQDENGPLFVLTWASFVGRLNKSNTKVWADSIAGILANSNGQAIFLNLDLKEGWEIDLE